MKDLIKRLEENYKIVDIVERRKDLYIFTVEKNLLHSLLYELKNVHGFVHLSMIACADWIEDNKFQLSYVVTNYEKQVQFSIRVFIDREKPEFVSIMNLWQQAEINEREIREFFGITFEGNPTQFEDFALEDWDDIPPMRRDFDTVKYSLQNFGERPGRHTTKVRKEIAVQYNEWSRK